MYVTIANRKHNEEVQQRFYVFIFLCTSRGTLFRLRFPAIYIWSYNLDGNI